MQRSLADAVYAFLLRTFPERQRARYGAEIVEVFHQERTAREREAGAWSALRYALAAYADVTAAGWQVRQREKQRMKYSDGPAPFSGFGQDVKHAVRGLGRAKMFTVVCLVSLAVGLSINAVLLVFARGTFAPPAEVNPDGAVELMVLTRGRALDAQWTYPDFLDVKRAQTGMDVTAYTFGSRHIRDAHGGDSAPVTTMYTSANYFSTLGIDISLGRAFVPEEDEVSGEPAIVISHAVWQRQLAGDPEILGSELNLNGTVHRVVGVAPAGYDGHFAGHDVDVWVPLWTAPHLRPGSAAAMDRGRDALSVIGRLHEGVTMAEADGALAGVMRSLAEAYPATNAERGAGVVRYTKQSSGETGGIAYVLFMGLSLLVLSAVCLNVAGMVMVRSATKQRELALRMALGSSRGRLIRYLMTETSIIALLGGLLGVAGCLTTLQIISIRISSPLPVKIALLVVLVCLGLSVLAMLLVGLSPALKFSRPELLGTINDAGISGRRSGIMHRVATSLQTAFALPLLVISMMVLQAANMMDEGDYGFRPDNLFVTHLDLSVEGYDEDDVANFLRGVPETVNAVAGVASAAVGDAVPLDYMGRGRRVRRVGEDESYFAHATRASTGYFNTIGAQLVRGRDFDARDAAGAEPVAIITESLARQLWPAQDAVGQRVRFGFEQSEEQEMTVIGVVADLAGAGHESRPSSIFVPIWQHPTTWVAIAVRAHSEDAAVATAIENAILRLDPDLTRPNVVTSEALMAAPKREIYQMTTFITVIGGLTLLLAALGVYGVVAFGVATRTREIGVRMAMGASRAGVVRMVLGEGAKLALPGVIAGSLLAAGFAYMILDRWYNYLNRSTIDWVMLSLGAGAAFAVVLMASCMPARRAAGVQPMVALRAD